LGVAGSGGGSGVLAAAGGVPLAGVYLEFLAGRCRPNTVRAAASDLRVFFTVVAKPPEQVRAADVLGFVTVQRTGRCGDHGVLQLVDLGDEPGGVSAATVRRRLSIVSGFFAFLQARGGVAANRVPRGLPTRRERSWPRRGVPLVRAVRQLPRILAPAEVDALTAALRTHRDRAMVAAMVLGGLRRCEVLGLRLGDLCVVGAAGVHRRGQGRAAAAGPGAGPVLRRGGGLPGRRAAAGRWQRPGVPGAQGAAPRAAAVG
jgi:site-specific recombinase XerD